MPSSCFDLLERKRKNEDDESGICFKKALIDRENVLPLAEPATEKSQIEVSNVSKKEYVCMICLEFLKPANTRFTSCGHIFHEKCLMSWVKNNALKTCPLCRSNYSFDSLIRFLPSESCEIKHDDIFVYKSYERFQETVAMSIFKAWPLSNLSKHQPKELLGMAYRALEYSQSAFKAEQFLQAYRLLRRSMHFFDGIKLCEYFIIFLKHNEYEYRQLEYKYETIEKIFDKKFSAMAINITEFKDKLDSMEPDNFEPLSSSFSFSQ